MEPILKFDLPFSDHEKLTITTLNFENDQHNEVFNNSPKEDKFNGQESFELFDDKFEGAAEINSTCDDCERKLYLEIFDKIEPSIKFIISNDFVCNHKFLRDYSDKFVEYAWNLLNNRVAKTRVRDALEFNFLNYKSRFKNKPFCDTILLFKANSSYNVKNKCGGDKGEHTSQFIHHLHKYHFIFDIFLHIVVKLHFILNIILHLIHLWVLSFTFRKKRTVRTLFISSVGGGDPHRIALHVLI